MNPMAKDLADGRAAADDAARWFLRLQDDSTSEETFLEWQRWMSASRANRLAYGDIENTALRLSRRDARPPLPSFDEIAGDSYDGSQSIAEWKKLCNSALVRVPAPRGRPGLWRRYALAAGVGAFAMLGVWLWTAHSRVARLGTFSYRTAPGQRQVVDLPEGSKVTLDADSALTMQFKRDSRALTLEHGEAYFEVAKDKNRPFVVRAGGTQVTALGTAFNVRMSESRTVVAVTEGKVEVVAEPKEEPADSRTALPRRMPTLRLAAQVSAGEAVSYLEDGNLQAIPAAEASLATGWLDGRRQYRNEPLRYVLADVDRYTGRQIEIADPAVGELRFTGTLNLKNSEGWLRGLSVALPVAISEKDGGTLNVALTQTR